MAQASFKGDKMHPTMETLEDRVLLNADWTGVWMTHGYNSFEAEAYDRRPFVARPEAMVIDINDLGDGVVEARPRGNDEADTFYEGPGGVLSSSDEYNYGHEGYEINTVQIFPLSDDLAYFIHGGAYYDSPAMEQIWSFWGGAGLMYRGGRLVPTTRPWAGEYDITDVWLETPDFGGGPEPEFQVEQFVGVLEHLGGNRYQGSRDGEVGDSDPLIARGPMLMDVHQGPDDGSYEYSYEYLFRGPDDMLFGVNGEAWFDPNRQQLWGGGVGVMVATPRAGSEYLPDLTCEFGHITVPQQAVPGDRGVVQVVIHNEGNAPARGIIGLDLFASGDNELDGEDDELLASLPALRVNIPAGGRQVVPIRMDIPADAQPGDYHMLASVDTGDAIAEIDETNNDAATEQPGSVSLRFGQVGDRNNVRLVLDDAEGTPVMFSLAGPGTAEVTYAGAHPSVTVTGAEPRTLLSIVPLARGAETTVEDIAIHGSARGIVGPNVDLAGDVTVDGALDLLVLDDTTATTVHDIDIWANPGDAARPRRGVSMVFDRARTVRVDAADLPIGAITASEWVRTSDEMPAIVADSIGAIRTRGRRAVPRLEMPAVDGDFTCNLDLSGDHLLGRQTALGQIVVAGDATGASWDMPTAGVVVVVGDMSVKNVDLTAETDRRALAAGKIVVLGSLIDTELNSNGNVGAVVAGELHGSTLFAGVSGDVGAALPDPGADFDLSATIFQVVVVGQRGVNYRAGDVFAISDSRVAAENLGVVRAAYVQPDNDGDTFGFAAESVRVFVYTDAERANSFRHPSRGGVQAPELGDFAVRFGAG